MTPGYLITAAAAAANVINRHWDGMENSTRWARSVPVQEVREFVEALPGAPILPTAEQIIDEHIVSHRDDQHMDIIVPVRLQGSEEIWALSLLLDAGPPEPNGEPLWLWGLGAQRLVPPVELEDQRHNSS